MTDISDTSLCASLPLRRLLGTNLPNKNLFRIIGYTSAAPSSSQAKVNTQGTRREEFISLPPPTQGPPLEYSDDMGSGAGSAYHSSLLGQEDHRIHTLLNSSTPQQQGTYEGAKMCSPFTRPRYNSVREPELPFGLQELG